MKKLIFLIFFLFWVKGNAQTYRNLSGFGGDIKIINQHDLYQPLLAKNGVKKILITSTQNESPTYKVIAQEGFLYNRSGFLQNYSRGHSNFKKDKRGEIWIDYNNRGYTEYNYYFSPCENQYQNICRLYNSVKLDKDEIPSYEGQYDFLFKDKYNIIANGYKTSLINDTNPPNVKYNYAPSGEIISTTLYFNLRLKSFPQPGLPFKLSYKKDSVELPYVNQEFFLNPIHPYNHILGYEKLTKLNACVNQARPDLFLIIGSNACTGNSKVNFPTKCYSNYPRSAVNYDAFYVYTDNQLKYRIILDTNEDKNHQQLVEYQYEGDKLLGEYYYKISSVKPNEPKDEKTRYFKVENKSYKIIGLNGYTKCEYDENSNRPDLIRRVRVFTQDTTHPYLENHFIEELQHVVEYTYEFYE